MGGRRYREMEGGRMGRGGGKKKEEVGGEGRRRNHE